MQALQFQHNIKRKLLLTVMGMCFFIGIILAQPYRSSLGVLTNIGIKDYYGTGPVFKIFFSAKSAAEAGISHSKSGYHLSLLYQHHFPLNSSKNFNGYLGAGMYNIIFPKAVLGLEYKPLNLPVSIAADWRPYYIYFSEDDIDPEEGFRHFGVSIRYVLKK